MNSTTKIKTIIFDLGGVVVPENGDVINRVMAEHIGLEPTLFRALTYELKARATMGNITLLDLYADVTQKIKGVATPQQLVQKHLDLYQSVSTKRNQEILDIINQLKTKYTVVCLTNTEIETAALNKKAGLFDYFDKAYLSTELGLMKPHKSIYEKVLNDLNYQPQEALLIDDRFDNNKAAEDVGMLAITYINPDQLKKALLDKDVILL